MARSLNADTGRLSPLSEALFQEVQARYLPSVLEEIRQMAVSEGSATDPTYQDIVRAFEAYFQPIETESGLSKALAMLHQYMFLIVATALTITFAAFGFYALSQSGSGAPPSATASGFLDIAKIFAGAIVGGAAGAATTTVRTNRRRDGSLQARPS